MLEYLPKYFGSKAIKLYLIALVAVSVVFYQRFLPLQWWIFGIVEVVGFWYYANHFSKRWGRFSEKKFIKKLFWTGFIIRFIWVIFSFYYYTFMTGKPFEFGSADSSFYQKVAEQVAQMGIPGYNALLNKITVSDTGYPIYLSTLYMIFGNVILIPRIVKAVIGAFTAVLIYKLGARTFGEKTGRMAGIFYILMPNLIYYTGLNLKEVEMVFLTVAFVERTDYILRTKHFNFINIFLPVAIAGLLFTFRTVLGLSALFAFLTAILLSPARIVHLGKRMLLLIWVAIAIIYYAGGKISSEIEETWNSSNTSQQNSMEWRSKRENANKYAIYASAAVFAPLIVVIPFPTIVNTPNQENLQLINGGNFDKNVLAFFVILSIIFLIRKKKWRNYLLIISFTMGYLVVIAFSSFAQSERFHQPVLPFLVLLAAYGVSLSSNKTKKYYSWYMYFMFIALIAWSWFKLSGRGLS